MQIESGSQITETKPTVNIGNLKGKAEGTSSAKSSEIKKFVTFAVGEEEYAVDIIQVREIQAWSEVTILPNQPDYMRGVLNLRGIIVPIFDLRCRFGQGSTEATRLHVVVIFAIKDRIVGVLVDRVSDILTVESEEIRPVPEMEGRADSKYILGLVTADERMVALLDSNNLFSSEIVEGGIAASEQDSP